MNRILLLIGASGSGKSTVARYLCEQYGLRQIDSYTTRPPRYRGESGQIFITDEEFDQLQDFVGYTLYNGHRYGATAERISYDADMFPYSGADLYLTNADSLRTANAIYQYLTKQE